MRFRSDFAETLRSTLRTSEVVSRKVALKKRGKEYMGLCPFHQEKSPSFTVNDEKEFYHCFGCGAHGDIIKFTMETEGLNYVDAIVKLANEYHITIPYIQDNNSNAAEDLANKCQERYYNIMEAAAKYFQDLLINNRGRAEVIRAQSYLQQRHFSTQAIQEFRLGYAPDSYSELSSYLQEQLQATPEELNTLGLVSSSDNGRSYDKFRGRLMFPIFNKHHFVIAFGGRVLDDSKPKYLNSPETPIFHKGSMVYNYSLARKGMYDTNQVVLVEGYIDATTLYSHGITNVVATLGTAVTVKQLQLLWHSVDTIIVCLDGDMAGQHAMQRVAELALPCLTPQKSIGFVVLPDGKDPDEFIAAEGAAAMCQHLQKFIPLSAALWYNVVADVAGSATADYFALTAEQKSLVEFKLNEDSNKITNPYVRKFFQQYFREQANPYRRSQHHYAVAPTTSVKSVAKYTVQENREIKMLELLLYYTDALKSTIALKEVDALEFSNEKLEDLKETLLNENLDAIDKQKLLQTYAEFNFTQPNIPKEHVANLLLFHVKNHQLYALEADIKSQLNAGELNLTKIRNLKQYELELRKEIFALKEILGVYEVS